jgi:hypothetical protein
MNANDDFSRCQKSVVQVFVKKGNKAQWKSVGTGFVVSPSQCLTCFHVIFPNDKASIEEANQSLESDNISVKVKFFTFECSESDSEHEHQESAGNTRPDDLQANERIVKVTFVSPMSEFDLAVLSWNGLLPKGVEIARLTPKDDLSLLDFRCYGYPTLRTRPQISYRITSQLRGRIS